VGPSEAALPQFFDFQSQPQHQLLSTAARRLRKVRNESVSFLGNHFLTFGINDIFLLVVDKGRCNTGS